MLVFRNKASGLDFGGSRCLEGFKVQGSHLPPRMRGPRRTSACASACNECWNHSDISLQALKVAGEANMGTIKRNYTRTIIYKDPTPSTLARHW